MRLTKNRAVALLILLVPCALPAGAQQTQDQQRTTTQSQAPIPAYGAPAESTEGNGTPTLEPDKTPLTGAQEATLGTPSENRTYFQPHLYVTAMGDSNPLDGSGSGWLGDTSIIAGLDLHVTSARSDFSLTYSGGAVVSNDPAFGNSSIQQMGFAEKLSWRRTDLSFFDQLGFIPENSFGYGLQGVGPPAGGNLLGLQPGFLPGDSILTLRGDRLANSSIVELDQEISARTSLTFTGGYSLMHYSSAGLLDVDDAIAQAGYSRQLSRANTIGLVYIFNNYRFAGYGETIDDQSAQLSFGRKLTGRLALRAAAGPELATFGGSGAIGGGTGSQQPGNKLYASGNVALTYQLQHTALGLNYNHGVSGGSGVLAGALTDQVSGYVTQALSRAATGGFNFGYARNRAIGVLDPADSGQVYGYWFGGVNWAHLLSRTANLSVAYQIQYQEANTGFCIGVECGQNVIRHEVSMTFGWRARPIAF